jgi:hypothetical protein
MGFRDPITSAAAVDTGTSPTGAGVSVYEASDVTGAWGIVEFRDGLVGDAPSTLTAKANLTSQGGGVFTAQGGSMVLKAGSFNGTPGPHLDLNVEGAPLGGFEPVARLRGGVFYTADAPIQAEAHPAPLRIGSPSIFQGGWGDFSTTGATAPLAVWLLPTGHVDFFGVIKNGGNLAAGAVVVICQLPVWARPTYPQVKQVRAAGVLGRVDIAVDGTVTWVGNPAYTANSDVEIEVGWPGPDITY